MGLEFVVIDDSGREVDWVDPVVKVWETRCYWNVKNGGQSMFPPYKDFVYRFWKKQGWQYVTRKREDNE